ncbi:DUF2207 domain-containing protein [Aquibacillus rhizosphaerae]|uniref:DUF2207 domain-containing protein n=1 Tax=Aquibacillus rhizosphaerae TaxID=3051431 RepID=A0ABT7L3X3_9BACI|nr:DUF2207 domain-containing protein [Aquibacillus sp. LR5S19]MDL4840563.1 DUF2207 domain-containing protein [Aquibacillus sp. LR5S19]
MNKIVGVLFLLLTVFVLVSCSNKEGSFTMDHVDIEARIDAEGIIKVQEIYNYTFNGVHQRITHSRNSKIKNFTAYDASELDNIVLGSDKLKPLNVTKAHNQYYINLSAENEPKKVVYSYEIDGAITKYNDVADLNYSFFENSNPKDLHNLTMKLYTPSNEISEATFFFFHSKKQPSIQKVDGAIHYHYNVASTTESHNFRLLFPAEELTNRPVDKEKKAKEKLIVSESSLQWRYNNLDDNYNSKVPFLVMAILMTIGLGAGLIYFHPNRSKRAVDKKALLSFMEKTDPLLVSFVGNDAKLYEEDIITSLFSLQHRGLISIKEVPSRINAGETFRFTWKRPPAKLEKSDQFIKEWLFKEKDEQGFYFLLESIVHCEGQFQSRSEKWKANHIFKQNFLKWRQLVYEKSSFKKVRKPYIPYYLLSFFLIFATLGMLIYFVFNNVWTREIQYIVMSVFTIFGCVAVFYKYEKPVMFTFFSATLVLIFFQPMTIATMLFILFILIAGFMSMIVPTTSWYLDSSPLPQAIKLAKRSLKKKQYPLGNTPKEIHKQMQYAMILRQENKFVEACPNIPPTLLASGNYPLLQDPTSTVAMFDLR